MSDFRSIHKVYFMDPIQGEKQLQNTRINEVLQDLFAKRPKGLDELKLANLKLDTSRPNLHDTKREFLQEYIIVEELVKNLTRSLKLMSLEPENAGTPSSPAGEGIKKAVDTYELLPGKIDGSSKALDLILYSQAKIGFFSSFAASMQLMTAALTDHLFELREQKRLYWSDTHRSPHHYPRTIALRLAQMYSSIMEARPTFGTAYGGHPSTEYGRALEKIFTILEIKSSVKNAANWAISRLTEDDKLPIHEEWLKDPHAEVVFGMEYPEARLTD